MRIVLALLITMLTLASARAETTPDDDTVERRLFVSSDACDALTAHKAREDVAYQPGVDVDGNAVAPADLVDPGRLDLDDDHTYWLEITVPLNDAIEFDPEGAFGRIDDSNITVGTVTLKDGDVRFNGEPLGSIDAYAVAEACAALQAESDAE